MFRIGERVVHSADGVTGTVVSTDGQVIVVRDDRDGSPLQYTQTDELRLIDSPRGPSAGADPVHTAMLRHARNAGAAVTALEIIRREAKKALSADQSSDYDPRDSALSFIEEFADDVLSAVLPA